MDKSIKKWSVMAVMMLLFLGVVVMSMRTGMESAKAVEIKGYEKWDEELVDFVAQMPVQDRERLKPVSTWASFKLYGMHASRTVKFTSDGKKVKLSPTEWLLDCMFRPDVADQLPLFKVNDDKVTTALGISTGEYKDKLGNVVYKKKADMYSYNELAVGDFEKELDSERKRIRGLLKEGLKLEGLDAQVSNLIRNLDEYKNLKNMFAANRLIPVPSELDPTFSILKTIEGAVPDTLKKENLTPTEIRQANVLTQYILLGAYISKQQNMSPQDRENYVMTTMDRMSQFTLSQLRESAGIELRTMPSLDKGKTRWTSWQYNVFTGLQENDRVTLFEGARGFVRWSYVIDAYDKGDQKEMLVHFQKYQKEVEKRALKRGDDLEAVASEVSFYRADYLFKSLVFFLVGSFVAILMLPSLQSKWGKFVYYCTWALAAAGNLCLLIGVIMRSILMERYPLGNLYDTILFSTFVAVLVLLFIEFVTRRRICVGLAAVIGALGMFLAYSFEVGNATDHMTPLNAVLRSNFWLSTHVTTIIIGYAGGIIASFLAIIALFGRMLGIVEDAPKFNRFMTRVVYGACCFTLLFSLVGTILGGIWANDSWGRFWGWDPKENGALMIVLWFLIILHARMAGYIKEWGLHICAVFGANIVAFSWWGVNFLSTGLHSYGFASGGSGMFWLMVYITFNTVIVFLSLSFAWYEKAMKKQRKRARLAAKESEGEPPVLPAA